VTQNRGTNKDLGRNRARNIVLTVGHGQSMSVNFNLVAKRGPFFITEVIDISDFKHIASKSGVRLSEGRFGSYSIEKPLRDNPVAFRSSDFKFTDFEGTQLTLEDGRRVIVWQSQKEIEEELSSMSFRNKFQSNLNKSIGKKLSEWKEVNNYALTQACKKLER
jgi:hypothetical protein